MKFWRRCESVSPGEWSLKMNVGVALLLLIALVTSSKPCFAQGATGSINGTVTDSSGAVIPEATVLLHNVAKLIHNRSIGGAAPVHIQSAE